MVSLLAKVSSVIVQTTEVKEGREAQGFEYRRADAKPCQLAMTGAFYDLYTYNMDKTRLTDFSSHHKQDIDMSILGIGISMQKLWLQFAIQ